MLKLKGHIEVKHETKIWTVLVSVTFEQIIYISKNKYSSNKTVTICCMILTWNSMLIYWALSHPLGTEFVKKICTCSISFSFVQAVSSSECWGFGFVVHFLKHRVGLVVVLFCICWFSLRLKPALIQQLFRCSFFFFGGPSHYQCRKMNGKWHWLLKLLVSEPLNGLCTIQSSLQKNAFLPMSFRFSW